MHNTKLFDSKESVPDISKSIGIELDSGFIRDNSRPFKHPKDKTIFMQGEPSHSVFFLSKGLVRVSKINYDGRKFTLDIISPDDFFGEFSLCGEKERRLSAETVEDSSGFEMDAAVLEGYLKKRPDVAIKMLQIIGDKRLEMETMLERMVFMDVKERVVSLLLRYSDNNGVMKIPFTHQEMADMTGATRVSVSRAIIELRKKNLIETNGERIRLSDINGLEELVHRAEDIALALI